MSDKLSRKRDIILACILAGLAAAVYLGTLRDGFVYDDIVQVVKNRWITSPKYLPEIFSSGVWGFAVMKTSYYRPMMHVVYMMARLLFGPEPWGFHLTNVLVHASVTVLVYFTVLRVIAPAERSSGLRVKLSAALGAGVFAVHTVHTDAVCWVAGLPDLLMALFFTGSVLAYSMSLEGSARSRAYRLGSLALFLLAAFSKEPALVLPALLPVFDLTVSRRPWNLSDAAKRYLPYWLVGGAYLALRVASLGSFAPNAGHKPLGAAGTVMSAVTLLGEYLRMLVAPYGLSGYHVFERVKSPADPAFLYAAAGLAVFCGLVYLLGRIDRAALFGGALIVLPLLPCLYVPALGPSPLAERYLYLPSAGLSIMAAVALSRAARKPGLAAYGLFTAAVAVIAVMGVATVHRNAAWKDDVSFWSDAAAKSGGAAFPMKGLGLALVEAGRADEGAEVFRQVIKSDPEMVQPYVSLGNYYNTKGDLDSAAGLYEKALSLDPDNLNALNNLGVVRARKGDLKGAAALFESAIAADPQYADAYGNLEKAYRKLGRNADAERVKRAAEETLREGASAYMKSKKVGGR